MCFDSYRNLGETLFNVVFWAAAGACHVRSSTLLTTSMVGALAALGVLQAGSRVAAGGGSIALIWVGCALFGGARGPVSEWPHRFTAFSRALPPLAGVLGRPSMPIVQTVQSIQPAPGSVGSVSGFLAMDS